MVDKPLFESTASTVPPLSRRPNPTSIHPPRSPPPFKPFATPHADNRRTTPPPRSGWSSGMATKHLLTPGRERSAPLCHGRIGHRHQAWPGGWSGHNTGGSILPPLGISRPTSTTRHRLRPGAGFAIRTPRCSRIAQLVEQAAVNRWVVGSSPTPGASYPSQPAPHLPTS